MREPGEVVSAGFQRPGRVLRAVLIAVAAVAVIGAVVVNWAPGGKTGRDLFHFFEFDPQRPERLWTWVTSGVLTNHVGFSHAIWSLVGLYFLTTDLEKRWGGARLLRFLASAVVMGNLVVLAVSFLPLKSEIFHPAAAFGPMAAIFATSMAWAKDNPTGQIRLFFFVPVSGRILAWITVGFAVLAMVFMQGAPEGAAAPFGGILAGLLLGGTPSPARSAWLRLKLALLRRRGHALTVDAITGEITDRRPPRRKGGPPLRIVQGGLDDDLKGRKPPKDKRYLN